MENEEQTFSEPSTPNPAPTPEAAPVAPSSTPSVHAGSLNGPLPAELHGFNWGAFFLSWIWGIGHNVWVALIALVPFASFIMAIVLGFKGNEWAWDHRKFESVEQFKKVQKVWMYWGLGFFIAGMLMIFMMWSLMFSLILGGTFKSDDFNKTMNNKNIDQSFSTDSQAPGFYAD